MIYVVKHKINTKEVKERAVRKLSQLSANRGTRGKRIRPMLKPVQVSKNDLLVRRIMRWRKSD